jgi:hypothetical protein
MKNIPFLYTAITWATFVVSSSSDNVPLPEIELKTNNNIADLNVSVKEIVQIK